MLYFARGYVTNWQCEIDIWRNIFNSKDLFHGTKAGQLKDMALVLTEPHLNPETIQNDTNEVVFEYFEFSHYLRRPSTWFSAYEYFSEIGSNERCCTVIDSGFSFSHAVPYIDSCCQEKAVWIFNPEHIICFIFIDFVLLSPQIRRVNVGGKLLTNYLKEIVSYRQWNMMDEFWLINQVTICIIQYLLISIPSCSVQ